MESFLRLQLCPCCACPVYWLPGFLYARGQPCWLHTYTVLLWLGSPHQCLIESRCFFQRPDTPQHDRVDPIGKTHSPVYSGDRAEAGGVHCARQWLWSAHSATPRVSRKTSDSSLVRDVSVASEQQLLETRRGGSCLWNQS